MDSLPPSVLRYGSEQPLPPKIGLRAGPLGLVFEEGWLRYLRCGDQEALRAVYVAVRDQNWKTIVPRLSNLIVESTADKFRVSFDARHVEGPVDFAWHGTIEGDERGTISFTMDGEVRSDFERNRIGFCVLHPGAACAGRECRVEHVDGTITEGRFPREISPHQPFKEIRSIAHECQPGVWMKVDCAGEVFEMEDQRNWTDDSFKTYCTPLELPLPVTVKKGTRLAQKITVSLQATSAPVFAKKEVASATTLSIGEPTGKRLPHIGLRLAGDGEFLSDKEIARLRQLNLSHLRVNLSLANGDYRQTLERGAREAKSIGVPLEVAIHLSDNAETELTNLKTAITTHDASVRRWLVFKIGEKYTAARWITLARNVLREVDARATFGAGTVGSFVELNRASQPLAEIDELCYAVSPQIHAFDNSSLMETLKVQAATVENTRRFGNELPVIISPVTFKPQESLAQRSGSPFTPGAPRLPPEVDTRQLSLFGAAWTVGSLKYLAEAGAASVTYFETAGWQGIMERESGSPAPALFPSTAGAVFPLYHVLADAGELANLEVISTSSSDLFAIDGYAVRGDGKTCVVVANLTNETSWVVVQSLGGEVRVRVLDESNAVTATESPEHFRTQPGQFVKTVDGRLSLELRPYAVARIDEA